MERLQKSQLAKISLLLLLVFLFSLTPFVYTSMRSSYLYFLLNLLIIVIGIEAGFLAAISKPCDEKKSAQIIVEALQPCCSEVRMQPVKLSLPVEKPLVAAVVPVLIERMKKKKTLLKKCSSRPSLFFIGGGDEGDQFVQEAIKEEEENEMVVVERMVKGVTDISKQELFMKAELFIGNFYKQLKMQRE